MKGFLLTILLLKQLHVELEKEVKEKMTETVVPYDKKNHNEATLGIFTTLISQRVESIKNSLEKLKTEEE
jgi:hypothetical protein